MWCAEHGRQQHSKHTTAQSAKVKSPRVFCGFIWHAAIQQIFSCHMASYKLKFRFLNGTSSHKALSFISSTKLQKIKLCNYLQSLVSYGYSYFPDGKEGTETFRILLTNQCLLSNDCLTLHKSSLLCLKVLKNALIFFTWFTFHQILTIYTSAHTVQKSL